MSLYQRFFAFSLAHGDATQHRLYAEHKRRLFRDLSGTVLEIGPGTGVNFPYYPPGLRWIGAEPNRHMHPYLKKQAAAQKIEIDLRTESAAALSLADESVDAAVSTLVLCSVADLAGVLREVRRVLKPGKKLFFIEHVAAETPGLRRAQQLVKPIWKPLTAGCRPDRCTGEALRQAGFQRVEFERFRLPLPIISPHIAGFAVK